MMVAIAGCESSFVHYKQDGTVLHGRITPADTGVMQINMDAHGKEVKRLGLDMESVFDNLTFARILYEREGVTPWVCRNQVAKI